MLVRSYLENASAEDKAEMVEAVSALVQDGTLTSFVLVSVFLFFIVSFVSYVTLLRGLFAVFCDWLF